MKTSIGVVKWFGGYNSKKQTENKFGFLQDISGEDVFLHENEWSGESKPTEDQMVIYVLEDKKGKLSAKQAKTLQLDDIETIALANDLCIQNKSSEPAIALKAKIIQQLATELKNYSATQINLCTELIGVTELCDMLSKGQHWDSNYELLSSQGYINPLLDLPLDSLPRDFIQSKSAEIAGHLQTLDFTEAKKQVANTHSKFSEDLFVFVLLANLLDNDEEEQILDRADKYIKSIYLGDTILPAYLKTYIDTHIKPKGGVLKDSKIGHIFSYYQFKQYLNAKDIKFVSFYENSPSLQSRVDTFILKEIFALVFAGNTLEQIYKLFLGQLWSAISSGKLDISRDSQVILDLFPACSAMPSGLSCEAIYWKKQDKYLCRGSQCNTPMVKPNTAKSYLDFTIYDWFGHYGINYLDDGHPSNRDFPIKLAGYFNRLREIFEVIHCRSCESLMLPDMKYARVEYTAIENGQFVKKDMAPAYRLTVFKCPNGQCADHDVGHYINHCLGFDCYALIDDRDCKTKCDAGLYICKGCGSCCADHGKNYPVGLCPDCGSPLKLYETKQYDSYTRKHKRFVECSQSGCGFQILPVDLSKRFYLDSCVPVISSNRDIPEKESEIDFDNMDLSWLV
tara:strand:- start:2057 stop:3925 length:1869 start_codon:yes stop_codon:yes gene_type:complete